MSRFTAAPTNTIVSPTEQKKQKEQVFVQHSQVAAKSIQQIMVLLKDARANVADPNKLCDKAISVGSRITNLVVPFIKTIKQAALGDEAPAHHVLQMIPSDGSRIHESVSELQKLVDSWSFSSKARATGTIKGNPQDQFSIIKDLGAQTVTQVKALSDAVLNGDVQEFAKRAKEVAVLLSKVIKHAQGRDWKAVSDDLLKDAQNLISAGKTAVKNTEAQKDFYQVVNTTLNNVREFLRLCKQEHDGVDASKAESSFDGRQTTSIPTNRALPKEWVADATLPEPVKVIVQQIPSFKALWDSAGKKNRRERKGNRN